MNLSTFAFAAAVVVLPAAASRALPQDACSGLARNVQTNIINVHNDSRRITLSDSRCRIDAEVRGTVRFTSDFRGIASVEEGGWFSLEERAGRSTRRLVATSGSTAPRLDYTVDGQQREIDSVDQNWLADRLLLLFRHSDLAAEERARWILDRRGLDGLIVEAGEMRSSSGRSHYMRAAISHRDMNSARLAALLRNSFPSSSSAQGEMLRAAVAFRPMDAVLVDAILESMRKVSSSSVQREVLTAAVAPGAPRSLVVGALDAASRVSSTSARSAILQAAAASHRFDDALLDAYLTSAAGISSSSGARDVLMALVPHEELDVRQTARVIRAGSGIASSSGRADFLTAVAAARRLTGEAREAYVQVARELPSSSQRARALEALEQSR